MYIHNTSRRRIRTASGVGLAAAALIAVAGCSPDETASDATSANTSASAATQAPASATHNEADVEFTSTMIGHHDQAVEMAELVEGRTDNAELIALASTI